MKIRSLRRLFPVLLVAPGAAVACGGLPPDFQLTQHVTTIRLGLIECPGGPPIRQALPINLDCTLPAEVLDEFGIPILEPDLVWRSSDTRILAASGGGRIGRLRGFIPGSVTVTVGDRLGLAQTQMAVQVLAQR